MQRQAILGQITSKIQQLLADLTDLYKYHRIDHSIDMFYDTFVRLLTPDCILVAHGDKEQQRQSGKVVIDLSEDKGAVFPIKPKQETHGSTLISRLKQNSKHGIGQQEQSRVREWILENARQGIKLSKCQVVRYARTLALNNSSLVDADWLRDFLTRNPQLRHFLMLTREYAKLSQYRYYSQRRLIGRGNKHQQSSLEPQEHLQKYHNQQSSEEFQQIKAPTQRGRHTQQQASHWTINNKRRSNGTLQ